MDGRTRAVGAPPQSLIRVGAGAIASTVLCLCAAGCSTAPQGPMAAATPRGPTVAFESIDGPPAAIFTLLVQDLGEEASARQVAVVSREGQAQYRVRGYLAALVEGKRRNTVIAWVWDVYDADQQRALRLSGEVPASGSGRGTWAAADEGVLRRIATTSMDQLAAFLASPPGAPSAVPGDPGPNIAANGPDPAAVLSSALAYAGNRP
ncbi:MAG TPA: hypothetical protein VGG01_27300 [Xanthobacteraceae bacterium]